MIEDEIFAQFDGLRGQADRMFDTPYMRATHFPHPFINLSFMKGGNSVASFSLSLAVGSEGHDWRGYTRLLDWNLRLEINRYGNRKPYIAVKAFIIGKVAPMNEAGVKPNATVEQLISKIPNSI